MLFTRLTGLLFSSARPPRGATLSLLAFVGAMTLADAQTLFVSTVGNGTDGAGAVRSYAIDGTPLDPALVASQSYPIDLAVSGPYVYVVNRNTHSIGKYALDGTVVNASLVTGLSEPLAIAVSGGDLYVANAGNNTVGKYTTTGAVVNTAFLSLPSNPLGVAVSGGDLFVSVNGIPGSLTPSGTLQKFTTAGVPVNTALLSGLVQPRHLTVAGGHVYLIHGATLSVGKYDASTGAGGILLQGGIGAGLINVPVDLAVFGSDLYVSSLGGDAIPAKIGHYTITGGTVNADLISGLDGPYSVEVGNSVNLAIGLFAGLTVTGTIGSQYTIEYTTSLNDPITWTPITSGTLNTSPYLYIDTSVPAGSRFYRAIFQ